MSVSTTLAKAAVDAWKEVYHKAPRATVAATVIAVAVSATGIYVGEQNASMRREEKRTQNLDYAKQARTLDETRANIQSLLEFVDGERAQLQLSQKALQSLKTEHEKLKPLLDSDRRTVDALFAAQEARNQRALSTERWIGFGLGVVSSLVASLAWAIGVYALKRPTTPPAA